MEPFRRLTKSIAAEGAAALVTLVETKGSSPREAGRADGGAAERGLSRFDWRGRA